MKKILLVIILGALLSLGFDMTYIPQYHMRVAKPGLTTKTFLQDATGRGNDLTNNNGATQISGNPGNAVQLVQASSQYLSIVSTSDLSPGGVFTICGWMYFDSFTSFFSAIAGKYINIGQLEYVLGVSEIAGVAVASLTVSRDGTNLLGILSDGFSTSPGWHFLCGFYSGTSIGISVDGNAPQTAAYSLGVFSGTDPFTIGAAESPLQDFVDGRLDGIGMWKGRVLSSAEIFQLYNGGNGLPFINFSDSLKSGLTAYYDFESQFDLYLPLIRISGAEFEDAVSVPGQQNKGKFAAQLYDTRDEMYSHLQDSYNRLKKQQRVEIYDRDDFLGHPLYTGVIRATPGDLGRQEISGDNLMGLLDDRKLMPDENLAMNARTALCRMTRTYQPIFFDDFERSAIGAKWVLGLGAWDIVNGELRQSTADGTAKNIDSYRGWNAPTWMNSKISLNFRFSADATTKQDLLYVLWNQGNGYFYISSNAYGSGVTQITTNAALADAAASRDYQFDLTQTNHLDIILVQDENSSSHYTATIFINGIRIMSVGFRLGGEGSQETLIQLYSVIEAGGNPMYFDNFVFAPLLPSLTPGAIDYTDENISQIFNGETQQQVVDFICKKLDWQYRLVPRAGAGNTWLDAGKNVGNDYSDLITLREGDGQNGTIVTLSPDQPALDFATWLTSKGQSQDTANANFISTKLDKFIEYGIKESEIQDERIIDVATAKAITDNALNIASQELFSFTGRILDESWIIEQIALWERIHWAQFEWAGLGQRQLRAGDWVRLIAPSKNIDDVRQIVSIVRRSGSAAIDLIFTAFTDTMTGELEKLRSELNYLRRSHTNRQSGGWSEMIQLAVSTNFNWLVYFHGQIRSVLIDIRSENWLGGAMTVVIDGVDRTNALFGSATIGSDKYAVDTLYLAATGNHEIRFNCTQAVLLSVKVEPRTVG